MDHQQFELSYSDQDNVEDYFYNSPAGNEIILNKLSKKTLLI